MERFDPDAIWAQIADDEAALERARKTAKRLRRAIREAKRVRREAIPKLRAAGLIR